MRSARGVIFYIFSTVEPFSLLIIKPPNYISLSSTYYGGIDVLCVTVSFLDPFIFGFLLHIIKLPLECINLGYNMGVWGDRS